jgi:hypothetical protein
MDSDLLYCYTGTDWSIPVTLRYKNSVRTKDLSTATDVSAAVVSSNDPNTTLLIAAPGQSSSAPGADWEKGVVVVQIARANTNISTYGQVYLELQYTMDGLIHSWGDRAPFIVKKGMIT